MCQHHKRLPKSLPLPNVSQFEHEIYFCHECHVMLPETCKTVIEKEREHRVLGNICKFCKQPNKKTIEHNAHFFSYYIAGIRMNGFIIYVS